MDIPKQAKAGIKNSLPEFLLLAVVAVLGFWLWGLLESSGLTDRAAELLKSYAGSNGLLAYGFFIGLAVLAVLLGPFTSAPVVPVALLLWGTWTTLILLMAGWMAGGMGAYSVGKYFGYPLVSKILSRKRADAWRDLAAYRLTFSWALMLRLTLPAETGYVFGLVKYPFWKFLAVTFLVELATGAVLVWGGEALVNRNPLVFAAWLAGGVIVFAGGAYLLRKKFRT